MRIRVSIDGDVANLLERLGREQRLPRGEVVREALRRGLRDLASDPGPRQPFQTRAVDLGATRVASLDDVAGMLAKVEGDGGP